MGIELVEGRRHHVEILDRGAFACALGGGDRRTLFITAADWGGVAGLSGGPTGQLLAVTVSVPGAGRP